MMALASLARTQAARLLILAPWCKASHVCTRRDEFDSASFRTTGFQTDMNRAIACTIVIRNPELL